MTTPNIQLLQSQRLTDNANGGGLMTNIVIPDNQADNLFSPISRINRTDGNVSLRKAIAMARTADTRQYLGAHAIISAPPINPGVSALMFSTESWTDTRAQAANFIESYLVQGPQTRLWPYGNQVIGQRSIICYQPPTEPLPNIGDTYVIVNGTVTPNIVQFIRITSLSQRTQTFTDANGSFQLNVITMGISSPLTATYPGALAQRYSTPPPPSLLCTTNVADAAVYHGVQTLTADVAAAAETVTLTSVFGQLLPSTQGEVPITNASPQGAQSIVAAASVSMTVVPDFVTPQLTAYAAMGVTPGSIQVIHQSVDTIAIDDGAGNILQGTSLLGAHIGTVDYVTGKFTFTNSSFPTAFTISIKAIPAAAVSQATYTKQQPVTQATRGYVYTESLQPLPSPKTLTVSYRALGRWFDLTDDGSGTLIGPVGAGAGSVRFDSGAVSVTLGALSDIGSNVVFSWGVSSQFDIRTGDVDIQIPAVTFVLSSPAKPSSVTITWVVASVTKTVTDNGSGVLSGDGTGSIDYGSGTITLRPTVLPSTTTGFSVAFQTNPATVQNLNPTRSGSTISITLSNAPIAPKSVLMKYSLPIPPDFANGLNMGSAALGLIVMDDGFGGLISNYGILPGTVDYTTGIVSFDPDIAYSAAAQPVYTSEPYWAWDYSASPPVYVQKTMSVVTSWTYHTITAAFLSASALYASSTAVSATNVAHTDNFTTPSIKLDLTPLTVQPIVPGSVMFSFGGDTYVDRAGSLYRAISNTTDAGTLAGTLDYVTGAALLSDWPAGGGSTLSIKALLTQIGLSPVASLNGRVPGQSLRPSSFFIQANRVSDGALITATADSAGNWTTTGMTGHMDVTTGFYSVAFGQLVLDSSLSSGDKAELWYNAADVDGTGHIWRPNEAIPGTIKYSCVVETFLPLSSSVLGLDPVRLPLDGRVQIFRPGDTLVFRNPLVYSVSPTPVASATITLPRGDLESAIMLDANATQVDTSNYTVDLATGIITMAGTINLTGYTGPYTVVHTVADMVLCTDVEITGQITFTPALVNAYPYISSFVSSALIAANAGNLQAGYDTLFEQTTWNFSPSTLWEDAVQGSATTAKYDDINYPIQVLDHDCITERWALIFTSSTVGNIASEDLGVIGTFDISHNVAPLNPGLTGQTATTNATFAVASVGSTQSVSVIAATGLNVGDFCSISDTTHTITGLITVIAGTTLTVQTVAITLGASGNTMASGATLTVAHPYFVIDFRGFGAGWSIGNAIRFNTRGAGFPIWFIRSVQVGTTGTIDDSFTTELRWDE